MTNSTNNNRKQNSLPEYISVISASSCAKIRIDDIEVVEQDGRKLHVVTPDKDYTFYGGMNTIAESLNERAFYRPIKSMILNLDHIRDISGYYVNFNSGQSVAMGRNALANTKKAYKRYLLRYPPYTLWEPVKMSNAHVANAGEMTPEVKNATKMGDNQRTNGADN